MYEVNEKQWDEIEKLFNVNKKCELLKFIPEFREEAEKDV